MSEREDEHANETIPSRRVGRLRVVRDFLPARAKLRRTGSRNVFADLGLPKLDQELLKARLTLQIYKIIKACGLRQAQTGEVLGIKQPRVSTLMRNRVEKFSVGRLIEFLNALGQDARITVKPTR